MTKIWRGAVKNRQGAVSHKRPLAELVTMSVTSWLSHTSHGNGSVFGFVWRSSPQAREGEEPARGEHLLPTASDALQNGGKNPDPSTRHLHANLILPKPVPTSCYGTAGNLQLRSALGSSSFAQHFGLSLNFIMDCWELICRRLSQRGLVSPGSSRKMYPNHPWLLPATPAAQLGCCWRFRHRMD